MYQTELDRTLEEDDELDELDDDSDGDEVESSKGKKRGSEALDMPAKKKIKSRTPKIEELNDDGETDNALPLDNAMQKIDESKKVCARKISCVVFWEVFLALNPGIGKPP